MCCAARMQATAAIAELFPSLPEPIAEADMAAGAAVVAEHAGGTGWGRMQSERCARTRTAVGHRLL